MKKSIVILASLVLIAGVSFAQEKAKPAEKPATNNTEKGKPTKATKATKATKSEAAAPKADAPKTK
ncbi:MAG TPA: hypothetical protein VNY36_03475 [Bacteroidia bacterium]|jgi:hypothetical protein|nr:hypothetical protein [Bacteroidia bacterium]